MSVQPNTTGSGGVSTSDPTALHSCDKHGIMYRGQCPYCVQDRQAVAPQPAADLGVKIIGEAVPWDPEHYERAIGLADAVRTLLVDAAQAPNALRAGIKLKAAHPLALELAGALRAFL